MERCGTGRGFEAFIVGGGADAHAMWKGEKSSYIKGLAVVL